MNMHYKTSLILLVTLLIGLLLGTLVSGFVRQNHFEKRVAGWRSPEGFIHRCEMVIHPDDPQREKVREILDRHAAFFGELHDNFQKEFEARMDSLKKELGPILTEEQKALFDRMGSFERRGRRGYKPYGHRKPRGHGRIHGDPDRPCEEPFPPPLEALPPPEEPPPMEEIR